MGGDGEEITLPHSVYQTLRQLVHVMASTLGSDAPELTTQEAPEPLNVSRSPVSQLLDREEIS